MNLQFLIAKLSNRKSAGSIIIISFLLLIWIYTYRSSNKSAISGIKKSGPGTCNSSQLMNKESSGVPGKCFCVEFRQEEVDNTCSTDAPMPLCLVTHIDHLNQKEFVPAQLKLHGGSHVAMFVHPAWDVISKSILNSGHWEWHLQHFMQTALESHPGAALLDVGSQLGVYSLLAARLGRKAVAIDAFHQNTIRLRASVVANGFEERIRVYWNALSTEKGTIGIQIPADCNIGGGAPVNRITNHKLDSVNIRATGLDDIVLSGKFFQEVNELLVKADMEGNEWLVTATGSKVFKRFKINIVLMEWAGTVKYMMHKAPAIINFYKSRNFQPYQLIDKALHPLNSSDYKRWPWDIMWLTKDGVINNYVKL